MASTRTTRYPADFIRDNLQIQTNVIDAAYRNGTQKLLFLGSSCIYPKHRAAADAGGVPADGPLEPTNEWYAIAKIAGLKMCQAYRRQYGFDAISVMPTNLYGPGDNFDLREFARAAGADAQVPRGEGAAASEVVTSGAPVRRGASSCTWTTLRTHASS